MNHEDRIRRHYDEVPQFAPEQDQFKVNGVVVKYGPQNKHGYRPWIRVDCGHEMMFSEGANWCVECKYGDKPYH
jgi:hypothetical protein